MWRREKSGLSFQNLECSCLKRNKSLSEFKQFFTLFTGVLIPVLYIPLVHFFSDKCLVQVLLPDQGVCPLTAQLRVPGPDGEVPGAPQEGALTAALPASAAAGRAGTIHRLSPLLQSIYEKNFQL